LATGTYANGFPNGVGQVEVYGALPGLKYPSSDLDSLENPEIPLAMQRAGFR
jgi:hypothetical protein